MSTNLVVLYISYALPHCTTEMIRQKFDSMFMNCVTEIAEEMLDDNKKPGRKFKRFWIKVEAYRHDPMMTFVLESVQREGAAKVYYEKSQGVDRYWKVKTVPLSSAPFLSH